MKTIIGKTLLAATLVFASAGILADDSAQGAKDAVRVVPVRIEVIPLNADQARMLLDERKRHAEAQEKLEAEHSAALESIFSAS